jgi:hypothetical protein
LVSTVLAGLAQREMAPVASGVAAQGANAFDRGMGADEEIGQHARRGAAVRPIFPERCASRNGWGGDFFDFDASVFDDRVPNRPEKSAEINELSIRAADSCPWCRSQGRVA